LHTRHYFQTCNSISEGYEKISTKTTNQIKDFTEKLNRNITETISQTLQSKIDPLALLYTFHKSTVLMCWLIDIIGILVNVYTCNVSIFDICSTVSCMHFVHHYIVVCKLFDSVTRCPKFNDENNNCNKPITKSQGQIESNQSTIHAIDTETTHTQEFLTGIETTHTQEILVNVYTCNVSIFDICSTYAFCPSLHCCVQVI
jgi:hypothetical protein